MRHDMDDKATGPTKSRGKVKRQIDLIPATTITPKRTKWLWDGRIPLGELVLLAGREGIGKSTICYQLVADITKGTLPGEFFGKPRRVIIVATEDSWECTIIPRLLAASADLSMVFNAKVSIGDVETGLLLPDDIIGVQALVTEFEVGMILLDPLMSRVNSQLNTHKDADVRLALEPMVKLAHDFNVTLLGIMHVNKDSTADAMTSVMGSRAFTAVTRAVLFCLIDPEDESGERRLLGQAKNNLGKLDIPTLAFKIESVCVGQDLEDAMDILSGRVVWLEHSNRLLEDFVASAKQSSSDKSAVSDAADWLKEYLENAIDGRVASSVVKKDGKAAGHSEASLKRALKRIHVVISKESQPGKPYLTYWSLLVSTG